MEPAQIIPHIRADPKTDSKTKIVTASGSEYETKRALYILTAPVMWAFALYVFTKKQFAKLLGVTPETNTALFDPPGSGCRYLRKHNPTSRVLHFLYNYTPKDALNWLDRFWLGNCNAQAVRNRKKLAKELLKREIRKQSGPNNKTVQILSLASGSAQAVIESVFELKDEVDTKVLLVDRDPAALSIATAIARRHGIADRLNIRETSVGRVSQIGKQFEPQIVEMIGFLDYISDEKAVKYFERIFEVLPNGGSFLTCNIHPNFEMPFTQVVVDWPMGYRWPKSLSDLLETAGFTTTSVVLEPHEIHGIAVGRKSE